MKPAHLLVVPCLFGAVAFGQTTPHVDFARDVQPILQQNCSGCHGPAKQNGGFRVDRRSSVFGQRHVVPGNTANSFLYHRITDGAFGPTMPPTGDLKPSEVETIRAWIEQGAEWPDAMANEADLPPLNPEAVAAVEMLRAGHVTAFLAKMTAKPALVNARGPEGSTPLMYAVLYADTPAVERLLKLGGDVNAHNDANVTPLMWGIHHLAIAQALVAHGANVNARSDAFRTPLMMAARQPGNLAVVKLLIEHGANANPNPHPEGQSSPLLEAVTAGSAENFAYLMAHGAEIKGDAEPILTQALVTQCKRCLQLAVAKIDDRAAYTGALQDGGYLMDADEASLLLAHGADPKAFDITGRTALMYAATSDMLSLDVVKLLVAHGADVNAKSKHTKSGDEALSVLDIARQHGETPVSRYLESVGAKGRPLHPVVLEARFRNEIHGAVQDSLPLLQKADERFAKNSGCVSCHNNSLTAMTMAMARSKGFVVDEKLASRQVQVNVDEIEHARELLHQGVLLPVGDNFSENIMGYLLLGLSAEGHKADLNTDAAALHLLWRQQPNGEWQYPHADSRQPLCLDHIGQTVLAMRALQLYPVQTQRMASRRAVAKAAEWVAKAQPDNNDDRGWKVAGLAWAGTHPVELRAAVRDLVATQRSDGSWSDLPTMEGSAYATGKSMVALRLAGMRASDPVYKRGVNWLLTHQDREGSWYVQTRALGFQPWSDAGFPHEYDQFISAAGTNWAAMALAMTLPDRKVNPAVVGAP